MTEIETHLLAALRELEASAQGPKGDHPKPDFQALFARIEELTRRLPTTTNSDLLHYLNRKSYQKARFHLDGMAPVDGRG